MPTRVFAIRLDPNDLAKAYDGLISKGIDTTQLKTISDVIRLTFFYGITNVCSSPEKDASKEALETIKFLCQKNKK